jgi:hypothetical protein
LFSALRAPESPPKSLDGIVNLLKTFTGNSSLDVNSLKDHLLEARLITFSLLYP